jgi:hypothetical protein
MIRGRFREELGWGIGIALSAVVLLPILPFVLLMGICREVADWLRR